MLEALRAWMRERHIRDDCDPPERAYDDRWFRFRVGRREVPLFPLRPLRDVVVIHDVHHALTGYETDLGGECELAAWEVGAGGCGWNLVFWVDRLVALVLGAFLRPVRCWRAFRVGLRSHVLYGRDRHKVLATSVAELQAAMGLDPIAPGGAASREDWGRRSS
jgi:hypothetical protein